MLVGGGVAFGMVSLMFWLWPSVAGHMLFLIAAGLGFAGTYGAVLFALGFSEEDRMLLRYVRNKLSRRSALPDQAPPGPGTGERPPDHPRRGDPS